MVKKNSVYFDRWYIIFAVAMLFFVCPYFFTSMESVGYAIYLLKYVVGAALLLALIPRIKIRFGVPHILALIFCVTYVIAAVRTDSFDGIAYCHVLALVYFMIILETAHTDERLWMSFLRAVRDVIFLFFICEIVFCIVFPKSLPRLTEGGKTLYYFLEHINSLVRYIMPGLIASCLLDAKNRRFISVQTAVFFIGFFYLSATVYIMLVGVVGMAFLLIWTVCRKGFVKALPGLFLLVLVIAAAVQIVVVSLYDGETGPIARLMLLVGKSPDISRRVKIWKTARELIAQRPVFGYGLLQEEALSQVIGHKYGAHNYYLDIAFAQGFAGLVPVLLLIVWPLVKWRSPQRAVNDETYIISGGLLATYIMMLGEVYRYDETTVIPLMVLLCVISADTKPICTIEPMVLIRKILKKNPTR
ncbi:MAG: O-antigen ligase family protein [Oscillospiraceae bacterium]|nr:O-antigen ligase family protein [Oscillospiraceae bacterium]